MDNKTDQIAGAAQAAGAVFSESTSPFLRVIEKYFTLSFLFKLIGTFIILAIFYLTYKLIVRAVKQIPGEKLRPHISMMIDKVLKYVFYVILVMYILSLFGVKLSAIWGAAGVAGIAIGFAAQTSISNIISGLFVLGERAMKIGDYITVGGVSGIVDSIDLLSVKIHTVDNEMIRIPNSTIINSNLKNASFHQYRRMNILVSVSYRTDMKKALEALKKAPALCPTILTNPPPDCWYDGFGDSGINLIFGVWFYGKDYYKVRNEAFIAVKQVFDESGIEIPYNKLDVTVLNDQLRVTSGKQ